MYWARLFCRCSSRYQSRSSSPMGVSSCVFEDSKGFGRFFAAQKPGSGLRWSQPPPTARGGCWRKVHQSLHVNRSFRGIAHLVSQSFRGRARPAPYAGGAAVLTLHDCPQPWPGSAAAPAGGNRSGVRRGSAPTPGGRPGRCTSCQSVIPGHCTSCLSVIAGLMPLTSERTHPAQWVGVVSIACATNDP